MCVLMSILFDGSDLNYAQNIGSIVLIITSISLFFLLSLGVRFCLLIRLKRSRKVPVVESIVPDNLQDTIELIWNERTWSAVCICVVVLTFLALERFDSLIIVNT